MNDTYILYNPLAGSGGPAVIEQMRQHLPEREPITQDMTEITDYDAFFGKLGPTDRVIVCGGDGTLNRFVNDIDGIDIPCDILYYAAGSGNDFLKDIGKTPGCAPFSIKDYIKDLPVITANGMKRRFINGVGLGLDGYCCAEVAMAKKEGRRKSYIAVAIQAFLRDFHPANVTVTVDGEIYEYNKVWLVPTMKGRFFGGGVMAAPLQDRRGHTVTLLLMHSVGRLTALFRFPTFMNGKHPKFTNMIAIHSGQQVSVRFDRPTDLQIDGEPMTGVTGYEVDTVPAMAEVR